jgi:DNA-binding transcriptional MerR regulator/effector-binding domain-containing protein
MNRTLPIGEFSRLTHLSVKTLRYYHDVGLLLPASVDAATGYRRYTTAQIETAHLIRRLRAIDMPVADLRIALEADKSERTLAIIGYLDRTEQQLADTQLAIQSLRTLLQNSAASPMVSLRKVGATLAVARRATVERETITPWCAETYPLLYAALFAGGADPVGIGGATYEGNFFEDGVGQVVAFVPISHRFDPVPDGLDVITIPKASFAVAVHEGPFDDLDRTYGLLGSVVLENGRGANGPIREYYLVSPADTDDEQELRTEVCWPIHPIPDPTINDS